MRATRTKSTPARPTAPGARAPSEDHNRTPHTPRRHETPTDARDGATPNVVGPLTDKPAGLDPWSLLHPIPTVATNPPPSSSRCHHRAPRRDRGAGVAAFIALTALLVYLFWLPLFDARVGVSTTWSMYGAFALVGAAHLGRARRRGAAIAVLCTLPWLAWAASWPLWSAWAPDARIVRTEQASILACGLLTLAAIAVAAGSRAGLLAHRRAWLALGVVAVPIGLWEVATQQHLGPGPWQPPAWSAAATFVNPNNFAAVLLVVYGLAMMRLTERLSRLDRVATSLLAGATLVVLVATWSRLAVTAALIVTAAAACLEAQRRGVLGGPRRSAARGLAGGSGSAARWLWAAVALMGAAALSPSLARFLFPGDEATARADGLRVDLGRRGLEAFSHQPAFGIGGGRFESLLADQGVTRVVPMHNGFIEILTEYGLVVALPLLAWLVALVWHMLAPASRPSGAVAATMTGRPRGIDRLGARYALGVWLAGFVVAGVVTSSPVGWPFWYLMGASATAAAWWSRAARSTSAERRAPRREPEHVRLPVAGRQ